MQYIRRIADAQRWDETRKADIEYAFTQLGEINKLRNDLLHYGAQMKEPNVWTISNKNFVHIPEKIQEMKITPETLLHATNDLVRIQYRIILMAWGDEMPEAVRGGFASTLTGAWQYKPPLRDRGSRKNRNMPRKRSRRLATSHR